MELSTVIILCLFITYFITCNEVGVVAKKKGLKFFPVFIFSFFATPIGGLLYAILLLHSNKKD